MKQFYMHNGSEFFSQLQISALETQYKAKYVLETSLVLPSGQVTPQCYAIFWQPVLPDPAYSHYVAIRPSFDCKSVMLTSGRCIEELKFVCIANDLGEVIYSHHRHDYRGFRLTTGAAIDGGRDYCRLVGTDALTTPMTFSIREDNVYLETGEKVSLIW